MKEIILARWYETRLYPLSFIAQPLVKSGYGQYLLNLLK